MSVNNGAGVATGSNAGASEAPMTFDRMINEGASSKEVSDEKGSDSDSDSEDTQEEDTAVSDDSDTNGDSEEKAASSPEDEEADTSTEKGEDDADTEEVEEAADSKDLEEVSKKASGKTVSVKVGGKEYKIPADAKFTIEKDGKPVEFSLKEAGNNILTAKEIDQKFSALDKEKRTFEREKRDVTKLQIEYAELEDNVGLIREAAHRGDMFEVAQATLNVFSKGDADVSKKLFDQLLNLTEKVSAMSEDQLKIAVDTAQLNFNNAKLKKEKDSIERKLSVENQRAWLNKQLSSKGIDMEEYRERYGALKELDKIRVSKGQPPRLNDKMTFEEIANETVSWTLATRVFNKVVSAISKVDPSESTNTALIDAVAQLTDPSTSEKDIVDIVREVLGIPRKQVSKTVDSSKEVSLKTGKPQPKGPVKKEATPQKAPKVQETKKREDDEGPVTFGKIISRYNN